MDSTTTLAPTAYRVAFDTDAVEIITTGFGFTPEEAIDAARMIIESETGYFVVRSARVEVTPLPA